MLTSQMIEEDPRASVSSLQTILMINHFSRSFCSLKQHDIAQIFHSPSIFMARAAGVFLPQFARPQPPFGRGPDRVLAAMGVGGRAETIGVVHVRDGHGERCPVSTLPAGALNDSSHDLPS